MRSVKRTGSIADGSVPELDGRPTVDVGCVPMETLLEELAVDIGVVCGVKIK